MSTNDTEITTKDIAEYIYKDLRGGWQTSAEWLI